MVKVVAEVMVVLMALNEIISHDVKLTLLSPPSRMTSSPDAFLCVAILQFLGET